MNYLDILPFDLRNELSKYYNYINFKVLYYNKNTGALISIPLFNNSFVSIKITAQYKSQYIDFLSKFCITNDCSVIIGNINNPHLSIYYASQSKIVDIIKGSLNISLHYDSNIINVLREMINRLEFRINDWDWY